MMRSACTAFALFCLVACGDGDPLGGPHGGSAGAYGPNGEDPAAAEDGGGGGATADAGGGGQSNKDGGGGMGGQDSGGGNQPPPAPTWTQIFGAYLAGGTKGNCSHCHSSCSTKSGCYTWLQGKGYISGQSSGLVSSSQSCLSWYGGNMPPSGPTSFAQAVTDMNQWAKAGALNN